MTKSLTKILLLSLFLLLSWAGTAQEYNDFEVRYQNNIKGDLTFIANNIVNRDGGTGSTEPEDAYNTTGSSSTYNDLFDMQYIDVDSDPTTFSSSSATFNFPNATCNLIRYAGLYWSATYPSERTGQTVGTNRQNDFNQVRLRLPGSATYQNITADEVLFDGFTSGDAAVRLNSPYACYADITPLITALGDPTGEYTIANVRSVVGSLSPGGGAAGGWTLVVVYENPNLSGKLITTFDGFARVRSENPIVNINYSGFNTIPVGPVRANIGVAALEGDNRITGDRLRIRETAADPYTQISNGANPGNNFFNSNITLNGTITNNRNPNSVNTLGYDTDILLLNNPANSVIDNNATQATFQFRSTGDQYYPFFNSFNVEILEPDIVLEKRVEDIAGNDITGLGVNLGQILDYVLTFQNIGNDDADNYTIRDVLPLNVTLDELNMILPTGVTYTYTPANRTILFSIPNNIVEEGDTPRSIRMRVQVAENCFDFIDACSDLIQNLAYSTYQGVINNNVISDDPSVTDFNTCGFVVPGATNFLLDDLADCNFRRTVQLCGDSIVLDAGDNFDDYVWVSDDNNNGLFDATDTVLNDGDPDNDASTMVVSATGTYIVDKIVADPCKGFKEIFDVERFGSTQTNPIVDWFNTTNGDADPTNDVQGQIVQCSVDGDLLPEIFLCGNNDSQLININISDAQSIEWEILNESSCSAAPNGCANKNQTCAWTQVHEGSDYTVNTAGKYRLVINYQNGCFSRFYFDAYQNSLDIEYNKNDIICTTDGNITITNLGANYGYQLVDITNNSIVVPFSANNGPSFDFATGESGSYRVDVVQLDGSGNPIDGACIFSTPEIGIIERDFQVEIETTPANCNNQGTIKIDVLNVEPNYSYTLKLADGTLVDDETAQPDNTHTFNVNAGDYIIEVATDEGCFDTQNITVLRTPDPVLTALTTANIGCTAGTIDLTITGGVGNPDFNYAIWSKDGTQLYANVGAIPGGAYQVEETFTFGWRDTDDDGIEEYFPGEAGDYVFVVVDSNNCFAFSNEVTIEDRGALTIDSITETQPSCSGTNDGALTINISNGVGPFQYSIDNGATYQSTPNFVNLSAGPYNIRVLDSSGCDVTDTHDLSEPFPLSASAGVSRDASCDPSGAEVRITNVVGGTLPYSYSFDGGATFGASTTAVLPPGTYTVVVRDASCDFPMTVTVEDAPTPPVVTLTPEVNYNCDGSGVITATPDVATYDYTYELDGVLNTPPTSNIWDNVAPGTYTVRTNYVSQTPPTPSLLLTEDFGSGETIPNPNTTGYFYENQVDDTSPSGAPIDNGRFINDYEYAVTDSIARPFGSWLNPIDHTSGTRDTDGRYLVINIGAPTPGQVIYQKTVNDIIDNQPISVSLWLINLMRSGNNRIAPDLTIELRLPGTTTVVTSANTGSVPENNSWNEYVLALDPGANSSLDLVITTNESEISGNDVAIDDIAVYQSPEVCPRFVELPVVVEAGRTFEANITAVSEVSCNGEDDATITFETENFDATAGFEYSIDGGAFIVSTTTPVTTSTPLSAGAHTIVIRKVDDPSCSVTLNQDIDEPAALIAGATITTPLTCTNGGATITASATGGTPTYTYQLEDTLGNPIAGYDFITNGSNTVFTGLAAGDYIVQARDSNNCSDPINTVLTIDPTNAVEFTLAPTTCYSGANDASIQVDVTNGNDDYTFSINGNPWVTPTPLTSTTHTFTGLANGTYTINVQDGSGCIGVLQTITIEPQLTITATAPNITACATETDISITAAGGDGNYVYAVVPNATTPTAGDFATTNPVAVNAAGDYDVHVRDNDGNTGFCTAIYTITIVKDAPIAITPTPTPVTCFGAADGAISIVVDSGGSAPFQYSIDNGVTFQVGNNFTNLSAGTYPVVIRDNNNCESLPVDVEVTQPDQLVAEATITQNYTCLVLGEITVGSITPTSGGSGDYQYSINGGAWTASTTGGAVFTDLTDDTYSIRVRDANAISCDITLADIIIAPLPTEPTITTSITYNCDGTGEITVLPNDPSYTYNIDGGTFQATNTFSNVAVGNHTIVVNYGSDCTVDTTVIVEDGNAFEASITAFENLDCNTDNSGTITITADNFGAGGYEYSLDATTFVGPFTADEQITGLSAQAYTITVRDVDNPIVGCVVVLNQTLTEPTPVVTTAAITEEFTCNNTGATITATATGGTPSYTYQLEDGIGGIITTYQAGTTFTNLAAGDYIIRAQDTNLCSDPIDTAITIVAPVSPTFTVTPTACYSGANDASIVVDVTSIPGNGGFQFSINAGPWTTPTPTTDTTYTFDSLANGTYTIDVRDAYGCTAAQQTITIEPQLTITATAPNITACATETDISITAAGGDGNYVYAVVPNATTPTAGDFATTNPVAVNAAGDYDVHVRDNDGNTGFCTAIYTITIVKDAPIAITPTPTPVTCFGAADGAISIVVDSGGSAPFQYSIDNGVTFQVGNNFTNLSAGTYPVVIRDNNNCESLPVDVEVTQPDQLVAEATITQNYTCLVLGEITVGSITPTSGGSGDYQYSINGGAWTASTTGGAVFTDLTDDTYSIRVRDANAISCDITLADIIIAPLPTEPTITTSITYNCDGTGEITVLPNDPSYTYNIDGGTFQATNTFSNVAVGNHTIVVNYGSDCTVDTTVIVEDGNAFEASITAFENLDCNTDNSGTITITADNFGAGGYEYSLDATTFVGPFTADEQITGLSAQAYTITVRDVDNPIVGCVVVLNQTLTEPTPVVTTAAITEEFTCNNTGATITATATGGTPSYTYQLLDTANTIIRPYQTSNVFTNVTAGDYIVVARDANGCENPINTSILIVAPVGPTFTLTPTACYSGNNDASIIVDVTSIPGNGGFEFSINAGPWITPSPVIATSYTFDSLSNGTYTINVRDAYGCIGTPETITINPALVAVVDVVDITCADGSITVNASGGDGSYEYAFVPTTTSPAGLFGASNTYTVTTGNDGIYDVYVRDNSAVSPFCEYVETVTVNPATPLTITATPTDPLCHDGVGSIEVEVTSGDNPYTIQIIDLDNGGASDQTDTNVLVAITNYYNLATGDYTIIVTDSNNCSVTETPVTINNPIELIGDVTPILPSACGSVDPNDYGFQFVGYPTTYPAGTTIQFSADGGATWTGDDSVPGTSDQLMGYISGTNVFPSIRTMVGGVEVCRTDLPRYTIPYPLDDLDISISTVVVACNELQVTVQGTAGVPNYEYTYTDDPANFVIGAAVWTAPVPGAHTWTGLVPGRTYVFYVRDSTGCIRQSNVNVNDITTNPLEITATYEPSCSGANDAEITYTITDTDATSHPSMRWEFYDADTGALIQTNAGHPTAIPAATTITVTGLAPAEYYIVVTEVDGGGADACVSGSENLLVEELNPITASLSKLSDISCNAPGLISVDNINGGGGTFTYTVTGPAPFSTITSTSDNPISIPANSPAGAYNVTITDQYDCFTDLGPINLDLTPNPTIDSMVVDNCASPTSLTIGATSTAAQILYSIDGGTTYEDNGGVFNNLTPGNYNIAIIDSNGCMDTDTLDIYPVLEANVTLTKLLDCTASPDAEITIDVTFGSGSYDYEISNGLGNVVSRTTLPSNPFVFQTTVPETYTITIYDDNTSSPECNRIFTIQVPPAIVPVLAIDTFTDVTCNGANDGTISVRTTDTRSTPYTFEIISGPGTSGAVTYPIAASSSTNTSAVFTGLEGLVTPGITYTIRATGANDC
ncbi:SprB repeat-containing protein, partial [Aurantibacter crassamenti]|uniref:SprB repeat-containing protein n=1 Tax=Aurantibacter crassamenti TaxID=1837375 RepID=UPI001939DCB9